jgi:chromate transporter
VPGPLFTFAAYLGAANGIAPKGWLGAVIALVGIFLPGLLLILGTLPFWEGLRRHAVARAMLSGINAAVVGLLAAALYDPVWISAITGPRDFALALVCFVLLTAWKVQPWIVVLLGACGGMMLAIPGFAAG